MMRVMAEGQGEGVNIGLYLHSKGGVYVDAMDLLNFLAIDLGRYGDTGLYDRLVDMLETFLENDTVSKEVLDA